MDKVFLGFSVRLAAKMSHRACMIRFSCLKCFLSALIAMKQFAVITNCF